MQKRVQQPKKYLKPQQYRVTLYRRFEECGVAQTGLSIDGAWDQVWRMYAAKYLPTAFHKAKAELCWLAIKLLFADREKPTDRVFYSKNQCPLAGVRIVLETF
jgi:hypothetical protein